MRWLKRNYDLIALAALPGIFVFALLYGMAHAQQPGGPFTQGPPASAPILCGASGCDVSAGVAPISTANITGPCTTGGMAFATGNQMRMRIGCGSTTTASVTIVWPVPRATIPYCVVTGEELLAAGITTNTTTTLTWGFTTTASTIWDVVCMGM